MDTLFKEISDLLKEKNMRIYWLEDEVKILKKKNEELKNENAALKKDVAMYEENEGARA